MDPLFKFGDKVAVCSQYKENANFKGQTEGTVLQVMKIGTADAYRIQFDGFTKVVNAGVVEAPTKEQNS
jgi:hypothetical protein